MNKTLFSFLFYITLLTLGSYGENVDLTLTLVPSKTHQTINHFGSSAAFRLNEITEAWSTEGLDRLAEVIFSRELKPDGNPKGIGMSSFRIEIGAGSRDQGDASRVNRIDARTECPLRPSGTYDWSKMEAETFWVDKCYEYDVSWVMAYSNSPPIYFTKNGLACRTQDIPSANLKEDCYDDYAEYLAQIALYYKNRRTPIHVISPVNEPQWEWICDKQEGTIWHNTEIRDLVVEIDKAFTKHNLETKVIITEGGSVDRVYNFLNDPHGGQLRFWDPSSELYIGNLIALAPFVAAHSYWTEDTNERLVTTRQEMFRKIKETDPNLEWWMTEYSFLGNGYKDGIENPVENDLGLFLAKVIHHDLTLGGASCWQYWETFSYLKNLPRYKLVTIDTTNETCSPNKTAWALGQYSLFVRPGAKRITVNRSDNATPIQTVKGVLPSAFINTKTGDCIIVLINYKNQQQTIRFAPLNIIPDTTSFTPYRSSLSENMDRQPDVRFSDQVTLPERSITTLVAHNINGLVNIKGRRRLYNNRGISYSYKAGKKLLISSNSLIEKVEIYTGSGRRLLVSAPESYEVEIPIHGIPKGTYIMRVYSNCSITLKKLLFCK